MHRLVEFRAVRSRRDGCKFSTFQTLINPEMSIPKDVQQVHGINDSMVRGQPTIEHVLPRFIKFSSAPTLSSSVTELQTWLENWPDDAELLFVDEATVRRHPTLTANSV